MLVRTFLATGASLLVAMGAVNAQIDTEAMTPTDLSADMPMDLSSSLDDGDFFDASNVPRALTACKVKKIVDDDFENHKDFEGWSNAKKDHAPKFSTFLGRYAREDRNKYPKKTFSGINKHAGKVKLEIDFYEIDSWDAKTKYGPDLLWIRIDGVKLAIGPFHTYTDEGTTSGSAYDIDWVRKSLGKPAHLGFNSKWKDQKHRITITIPKLYYSDGQFSVQLGAEVTSRKDDESAGWDNIKIYELFNCDTPPDECTPSKEIASENFEDGSTAGWSNARIEQSGAFTKFLGRYGKGDKQPKKTYTGIPKNAKHVILFFDFYEIDSWDGHNQKDYACVTIDGKTVDMGRFSYRRNENGRSGHRNGMHFSIKSETPRNIGFRHYTDQIHHVELKIPNSFYKNDGKFDVTFQHFLTHYRNDEAAGWDNIKIVAYFDCDNACTPSRQLSFENFENGKTTGWHRGRLDQDPGFTKFLGRYGKNDKDKGPFKTFNVPKDAKQAVFEFDFYEIDSWDRSHKDYLCIVFDGKMVDLETFNHGQSEDGRTATRQGVRFVIKSTTKPKHIGFNKQWLDEIHHVTMYVPNSYYKNDGQVKIEFQPRLSEALDNESAGFDNIKLTAKFDCKKRMLRGMEEYQVEDEDAAVTSEMWEYTQYSLRYATEALDGFAHYFLG